MFKLGELVTGNISALAFGGSGIMKKEGIIVFVPFSAPGDHLTCRITQVKKQFAFAEITAIHESSSERTAPKCPYFGVCGGCQLQHLKYPAQVGDKRQAVQDAFKRIGKLEVPLPPCVPSKEPWAYRNHVTLHLRPEQGIFKAGYFALDNKTLLQVEQCPIFCTDENSIFKILHQIVQTFPASSSNEGRATLLKLENGAFLVLFNFKRSPPRALELIQKAFSNFSSTIQGIILSSSEGIWSCGQIENEITAKGLRFQISPRAFLQNHFEQSLEIYASIINRVVSGPVFDLYCGIGILSLLLARKGLEVTGVEMNKEAVCLAKKNAVLNGLKATFYAADVKHVLCDLLNEKKPSSVVVNPPREGLEVAVVRALCENGPDFLHYISCMPSTLARDLKSLSESGYVLKESQTFDMFPQTGHVETLVYLAKS